MDDRLRRIAGVGALLSMLLSAITLLPSTGLSEDAAEFLILLAPLALLPVVLVLHRLFRTSAPRASLLVVTSGILGCLALPILLAITVAPMLGPWLQERVAPALLLAPVALAGVWMLLAALLGRRTRTLPLLLVLAGIASGVTWLILLSSAALPQPQPLWTRQMFSLNILFWLVSYTLWTVGLGIWLLWPGGHIHSVA